jgi:hypothetical protein
MDAKEQEYQWCMDTIEGELAELAKSTSNEEDAAGADVGTT